MAVTLTASGPVTADPRTDLGHGMLAGAGFVLEPVSGEPQEAAAPPSAVPEPPAPPPPGRERVDTAIRTPSGETVLLADEIAHLVAEDGSRVPIDRPYVLGRDPRQDPAVRRGAASPVFIPDPEQTVSRVQAYLDIDGGVLTIRDAGSSNGTDVAAPGDAEWTRLGNEPFALPVGWSLRIGRRVYTYIGPGRGRARLIAGVLHRRAVPGTEPGQRRRIERRPRFTAVVAAARNSGCDPSASTPTTTPSFTNRRRYDGTAGWSSVNSSSPGPGSTLPTADRSRSTPLRIIAGRSAGAARHRRAR